jgi:hypothetical protein
MERDPRSAEEDVDPGDAQALSRPIGGGDSDDPDAASTTGTGRSGEFVGRVSGQDVGYTGEIGAEQGARPLTPSDDARSSSPAR